MKEIRGKTTLVQVSARYELGSVRVIVVNCICLYVLGFSKFSQQSCIVQDCSPVQVYLWQYVDGDHNVLGWM